MADESVEASDLSREQQSTQLVSNIAKAIADRARSYQITERGRPSFRQALISPDSFKEFYGASPALIPNPEKSGAVYASLLNQIGNELGADLTQSIQEESLSEEEITGAIDLFSKGPGVVYLNDPLVELVYDPKEPNPDAQMEKLRNARVKRFTTSVEGITLDRYELADKVVLGVSGSPSEALS